MSCWHWVESSLCRDRGSMLRLLPSISASGVACCACVLCTLPHQLCVPAFLSSILRVLCCVSCEHDGVRLCTRQDLGFISITRPSAMAILAQALPRLYDRWPSSRSSQKASHSMNLTVCLCGFHHWKPIFFTGVRVLRLDIGSSCLSRFPYSRVQESVAGSFATPLGRLGWGNQSRES